MTLSNEVNVIRGEGAEAVAPMATRDLRSGNWTRLGSDGVRGDSVTEEYLEQLADKVRAAARAQGYAVGWAEGRRRAAEEAAVVAEATAAAKAEQQRILNEQHRTAQGALATAIIDLVRITNELQAEINETAAVLAQEIVATLLGHELRLENGTDVLLRALKEAPTETGLVIKVHPGIVNQCLTALSEDNIEGVVIEADSSMARGDSLVEADHTVVDLRLSKALQRVREALA